VSVCSSARRRFHVRIAVAAALRRECCRQHEARSDRRGAPHAAPAREGRDRCVAVPHVALRSRHCAILPISCAARRSRRHRGANAPCCGLAFTSTPPARRSRRRSGERVYAYEDEHPTEHERYEIANAREHVMELQCSTFANVSLFCRAHVKCGDKVGPNVSQIRGPEWH
jgi:hypothetical protein